MKRAKLKGRNVDLSSETKHAATQTDEVDNNIEIIRLQERVKALQLENDVLRKNGNTTLKKLNSPLRAENSSVITQIISETNDELSGCGCKKTCSSKLCGCRKKNNKCNPSCKCDDKICRNQEDKENVDADNAQTSKKQTKKEKNNQMKSYNITLRTRKKNELKSDSNSSQSVIDPILEFDPMKPKHQLLRTPPKNREPASHVKVDNFHETMQSSASTSYEYQSKNTTVDTLDISEEVDWEQHTAQLVACKKCKRTFMPHRIQKHEACCKRI